MKYEIFINWMVIISAIAFWIIVTGVILLFLFNFIYELYMNRRNRKMRLQAMQQQILQQLIQGQDINIQNGELLPNIDMKKMAQLQNKISEILAESQTKNFTGDQLQKRFNEFIKEEIKPILSPDENNKKE